jgi:hypothetical protein
MEYVVVLVTSSFRSLPPPRRCTGGRAELLFLFVNANPIDRNACIMPRGRQFPSCSRVDGACTNANPQTGSPTQKSIFVTRRR